MPRKINDKSMKLILRLETKEKTVERVIEGSNAIERILFGTGILDGELLELLGYEVTSD